MDVLKIVDGLEWVRKNRDRFFDGQVTGGKLANALVEQALVLGATDAANLNHDNWQIVGATRDWFREGRFVANDIESFRRVLPLPEAGQYSLRAEILIAAFARDIVTISNEARYQLETDLRSEPAPVLETIKKCQSNHLWEPAKVFES